ncbi:proton-conducting transporter transmembrane domain-containing protein [Tenggerimyces flavus]|uniref:Proton-conducting transporter membrane subunit n=1 Tax=Tenggerimyces flavus TaxID=1708749 RepID=A0ABV7YJ19_9ACTN|nr:proton-conducting transporter membrane subunit [Tenggerimyces flavus]MBM7789641.1 hydrogenase-4 component F [Tenggerimyces flavus]
MSVVLTLVPVLVPLLGASIYALIGWRVGTRWVALGSALVTLAAGITLAVAVSTGGAVTVLGGLLRVDALSAFMVIVIGAVGSLATAAGPGWLAREIAAGRATDRTARRHSLLVQAFLGAMAVAVLAANLGVLWAAVEATTIATAFLVGQRGTRTALEAAWKYVVICSVGIALAFLGTVLLNYAALHAGAGDRGLDWTTLVGVSGELDPGVTRLAVALLIVGFGTKAGLVPLHAWLPDAHGQAPAPVSALMSGVLLSVAFYAILRVKAIADPALGVGFARGLLVVIALASLLVSASLLLAQRDYKRMLAYSSIEHMGLLALGAAAGTAAAIAAVLLHILGHGLAKSVVFIGSGHTLQVTGTSTLAHLRGLLARHPVLAASSGLGILALVGFPPFSLFASTLGIATAGFGTGLTWPTAAALVLMLTIAAALLTHTGRILLGPAPDATSSTSALSGTANVPLVLGLVACAAVGIGIGPLEPLIRAAAATVTGGTP